MASVAAPLLDAHRQVSRGMRSVLVRLHRAFGLGIAAFLILASLTGSLLVFQKAIDAALNPRLWGVEESGPSLSPQRLADAVTAADPRVTARWIPLDPGPERAADIRFDWAADPLTGAPAERRYDQMFVDPVSGQVLESRVDSAALPTVEGFVPFVHRLHSALLLTVLLGLAVAGLAITGVAVWWRKRSASRLAAQHRRRRPFDIAAA